MASYAPGSQPAPCGRGDVPLVGARARAREVVHVARPRQRERRRLAAVVGERGREPAGRVLALEAAIGPGLDVAAAGGRQDGAAVGGPMSTAAAPRLPVLRAMIESSITHELPGRGSRAHRRGRRSPRCRRSSRAAASSRCRSAARPGGPPPRDARLNAIVESDTSSVCGLSVDVISTPPPSPEDGTCPVKRASLLSIRLWRTIRLPPPPVAMPPPRAAMPSVMRTWSSSRSAPWPMITFPPVSKSSRPPAIVRPMNRFSWPVTLNTRVVPAPSIRVCPARARDRHLTVDGELAQVAIEPVRPRRHGDRVGFGRSPPDWASAPRSEHGWTRGCTTPASAVVLTTNGGRGGGRGEREHERDGQQRASHRGFAR